VFHEEDGPVPAEASSIEYISEEERANRGEVIGWSVGKEWMDGVLVKKRKEYFDRMECW
jgi:hypothetical protein